MKTLEQMQRIHDEAKARVAKLRELKRHTLPVTPCIHLGAEIGTTRQCGTCRGSVKLKEYACAAHGKITMRDCQTCPDKKPIRPTDTRHLIYHIYPVKGTGCWQKNIEQLRQREKLFNGRRIVAIVTDHSTDSVTTVQNALGSGYEIFATANDPTLREVVTWVPLWDRLPDDYSVVFCAHAKGVRHSPHIEQTPNRWTEIMYRSCLDYWPLVEERLQQFSLAGSFKKNTCGFMNAAAWHYSGTFYWVHRKGANYKNVDQHWTGTESWPGLNYAREDAGSLFFEGVQWPDYDVSYFNSVIEPAWEKWKSENQRYLSVAG